MQRYEEILAQAKASNYLDALIGLIEILDDEIEFKNLYNTAINPPDNFNEVKFIKRVILYIVGKKSEIIALFSDQEESANDNLEDKICYMLYNFDFEHQTTFFKNITSGNRPFWAFTIRGVEKILDKDWLIHQLLFHYPLKNALHQTIELDFNEIGTDVDNVMRELCKGVSKAQIGNREIPEVKFRSELEKRLETKSQFFLIRNAYSFLHSADFDVFITKFESIFKQIIGVKKEHKCIFIFIEDANTNPYQCGKYCKNSREIDESKERLSMDLAFIDLDIFDNVNAFHLKNWLKYCKDDDILTLFNEYFEDDNKMQEFIDCGNPHKIIPKMYDAIDNIYKSRR